MATTKSDPIDELDAIERRLRSDQNAERDLLAELDTAPDRVPIFTFDKEGDMIQGVVEYVGELVNDYGETHVLHLRDRDGSVQSVAMFGTVLKNFFKRANPKVGDAVRIRYSGKATGKSGRSYDDFVTAHVRA